MAAHHHHHHDHDHELMDEKTSRESNKNNNNMMVTSSTTSFCYSDVVVHPPHNLGFSNHGVENFESNPEIYNLTSGIEMIGFQPKNQNQNQNLMVAQQQQQQEMGFMDESSLRPCVFPCEGNERPSQGLSLSLSSSNPSTISLQSFELRHNNSRDLGFMRKLSHQSFHQQQQQQQQVFLGSSSSNMSMQFEMMRSSKYMGPTQELLSEFCNLGTKQNNHDDPPGKKQQQLSKKNKHQWEHLQDQGINNHDDDHHHHLTNHSNNNNNNNNNSVINDSNNNASSSTSRNVNPSLYGVSLMELQKRKTKLLAMLEELDKRYKHYCEQMKGVVCSFEAVAGPGAADVYSALASKAMSRHFRCLRDAIVAQIMSTKKAMGEKDANNNASILGTTKGETPRLRVLDQNLRQQRAYQQMTMMESHPWRPQRGLPERSVSILRAWLFEHFLHPYPSDVDKHILARQTGLSRGQVSNWFINARVRLWKPMVEQMYLEETKEDQDTATLMGSSSDHNHDHLGGLIQPPPQPPPPPLPDQKPNHDQLIRIIDHQDSLSSIINTTTAATTTTSSGDQNRLMMSNPNVQQSNHYIGRIIQVENFGGSMDNHLNFASSSSYNHAAYGTNQNDNNAPQQGFGGGNNNNNVSLTLGLQQHGGNNNGVSLAYSPSTHTAAASLFYGREHMEEENCQPVHQFSLLEGDHQTQNNLPYRNLMGAQVLHDFA